MRFYTKQHRFYCGIDLHARTTYVCIMDHEGTIFTHRNLPAATDALADVLRPYQEDLVLAVECIFTWYWVADLCSRIGVEFVLGHALYMKAIHGGKVKNDEIAPRRSPPCFAAECSPWPMCIRKGCAQHGISFAAGCTFLVIMHSSRHTSKTPILSTTCPLSKSA